MWGIKPEREICLDESLLLFKGRLHFRQYLPAKKSRLGIKFSTCVSLYLDIVIRSGSILVRLLQQKKSTE